MLTTPIFINTVVVFVRLYYFEREFKGISTRSKKQSRYRRNFTREMALALGMNPDKSFLHRFKKSSTNSSSHSSNKYYTKSSFTNYHDSRRDLELGYQVHSNDVTFQEKPILNDPVVPQQSSVPASNHNPNSQNVQPLDPINSRDIRFGLLPHPPRISRQDSDQPCRCAESGPEYCASHTNVLRPSLGAKNQPQQYNTLQKQNHVKPEVELTGIIDSHKIARTNKNQDACRQSEIFSDTQNDCNPCCKVNNENGLQQICKNKHVGKRFEINASDTKSFSNNILLPKPLKTSETKPINPDHQQTFRTLGSADHNTGLALKLGKPPKLTKILSKSPLAKHAYTNDDGLNESDSKDTFVVSTTEVENISKTETDGDLSPPPKAFSFPLPFSNKQGTSPGNPRHLEHFDYKHFGPSHLSRTQSPASERYRSSVEDPNFLLKKAVRARSLDRTYSFRPKRVRSFEQMAVRYRDQKSHFLGKDSHSIHLFDRDRYNRHISPSNDFGRSSTLDSNDVEFPELSRIMSSNYLSYQPTIEGNSVFVNLNDEQKDELGGVEYRALKILAKILVWYYIGWHIILVVLLVPWGSRTGTHAEKFKQYGFSPVWWGIFTAASAFNNLGLTLTPNSMAGFTSSTYVLIIVPLFMIIGNTGFPIFLRFIIWIMFKISKRYGRMHETLGFLLDHPRRCFTLLFPSGPTWWLFGVLVALNVIDTVLFLILDLNNKSVDIIPVGHRILSGFFQAVATRTTGLGILVVGELHPAVLVSYTIMMYINIFPVVMSVRHTNVYEEQTLGINRAPPASNNSDDNPTETGFKSEQAKNISDVRTHLMRQLSYDLWFMFISLFIICISEEGQISRGTPSIPVFNILFEITSAYGTVGLSTGYPNVDPSLSSKFSVVGKLVIIGLLYRGRQRSLPYAIDRAIILPSSKMERNDRAQEEVIRHRMPNKRVNSIASGLSSGVNRRWYRD